jgi:hypothetical protein
MATIGKRIKDYVEKHTEWSFAQFCELVGVSYETGRKWVKGETAPNRNRAKVIADKLGKTTEWVLVGEASDAMHWRLVADEAARQLHESLDGGGKVDPVQFLRLVDLLAEAIPADAPADVASSTVTRHLRLVASGR